MGGIISWCFIECYYSGHSEFSTHPGLLLLLMSSERLKGGQFTFVMRSITQPVLTVVYGLLRTFVKFITENLPFKLSVCNTERNLLDRERLVLTK